MSVCVSSDSTNQPVWNKLTKDACAAGEEPVDEHAEPVPRTHLDLAGPSTAPGGEGLPVTHRVGRPLDAGRLPLGEPVLTAEADLTPLVEVGGDQRPEHQPTADERRSGHVRRCNPGDLRLHL